MISVPLIGVATTLLICATMVKLFADQSKKANKSQKGEIIKQLLALSERENCSSVVAAPPASGPCSASTSVTCGDTSRKGTSRGRNSKRRYPTASQKKALKFSNSLKKKSANARMSCIKNVAE